MSPEEIDRRGRAEQHRAAAARRLESAARTRARAGDANDRRRLSAWLERCRAERRVDCDDPSRGAGSTPGDAVYYPGSPAVRSPPAASRCHRSALRHPLPRAEHPYGAGRRRPLPPRPARRRQAFGRRGTRAARPRAGSNEKGPRRGLSRAAPTAISAAARTSPSGTRRPRARTAGLRGSPTPPATGRGACRRRRTPWRPRSR